MTNIRRVTPIDPAKFKIWKEQGDRSSVPDVIENNSPRIAESEPDPSRPWFQQIAAPAVGEEIVPDGDMSGPSFEEIVELISSGKPVPGIRQIPDVLSSDLPSESTVKEPPKKPWERDSVNQRSENDTMALS